MAEIGRSLLSSALARITSAAPGAALIGMKAIGSIGAGNLASWLENLKTQVDTIEGNVGGKANASHSHTVFSETPAAMDFTNEARNTLMTGGGTISWGTAVANRLKWTTRLILIPVASAIAPDNHVTIPYPANVLDWTGAERVNADGILLNGWEALVLTHTRGSGNASGNTLRVIEYQSTNQLAMMENEEAFILAVHNGDSGHLTLRNGLTLRQGSQSSAGISGVNTGYGLKLKLSTQQALTANAWNTLRYQTVTHDSTGGGTWTQSTARFQPKISGIYGVMIGISVDQTSEHWTTARLNATEQFPAGYGTKYALGMNFVPCNGTTDFIELNIWPSVNCNLLVANETVASIHLVSRF